VSGIVGTENIITSKISSVKENEDINILNTPLTNPRKVYLPSLHIKIRLIKNFVQGMEQNSAGFMYLKNKFPRKRDARINEGVFVGPQIRESMQDVKFEDQLCEVEKSTRTTFKR
jgi:hypothetical protein